MKRLFLLTLFLVSSTVAQAKNNEHIKIVTQANSPVNSISKSQLKSIFMGNLSVRELTPIALSPGEVARSVFNVRVVGLTESRIQAYWAQMRFSGRQQRPQTAQSIEELILMIESTDNTIGYLPEDTPIPSSLKVIYRSSEN